MRRIASVSLLIGGMTMSLMAVRAQAAEDAARAFEEGIELLTEAKFSPAMQAFLKAVEADPGNREYRQTYAMLRQIIWMREQITKEQDPERWTSMAQALRAFYHSYKVYAESLPLDRKIHEQRLAPDSAAMLAETLLALGNNSETAEMLAGLGEDRTTPRTNVLLGVALARQGRIAEAKTVAERVRLNDDSGPRVFYEFACARALTGDSMEALEALTRSFELTPPSRLDEVRAEARGCPDFQMLAGTTGFAEALKVNSKITESGCSQGASCSQCPKRATCGRVDGKGKRTGP